MKIKDKQQWFNRQHLGYYRGGQPLINYYNQQLKERRKKYKSLYSDQWLSVIEEIENKGYIKIENFFDKQNVLNLTNEFNEILKINSSSIVKTVQEDNHTIIVEPLINTEQVINFAFDERIISIASCFFDCLPGLGTFNLRASFVNNKPLTGTNLFHRDFNSPVKFIKFFVYLTDVNIDNGPFTYVEGSHDKVPSNWSKQHRWSDSEIENIYGQDKIRHLTANVGDLLIATTNGFHKGLKIKKDHRIMLTLNYLIHPEMDGAKISTASPKFHIKTKDYTNLSNKLKPVADFLIQKS